MAIDTKGDKKCHMFKAGWKRDTTFAFIGVTGGAAVVVGAAFLIKFLKDKKDKKKSPRSGPLAP
ncbi:hypothetical protein FOA52_000714 [Chlamydomonas sp. UWO 241]|nr:hypothetical protein FOA52_000714 [Chlamydomonas sp. UWO 241]